MGRTIVLLMASTGMRAEALSDLKLKHRKRWEIDNHSTYVYQITVYTNSPKYRYKTFCNPEYANALDICLQITYNGKIEQDPQAGN